MQNLINNLVWGGREESEEGWEGEEREEGWIGIGEGN